jgi:hypothetical protein
MTILESVALSLDCLYAKDLAQIWTRELMTKKIKNNNTVFSLLQALP